jgi:2-dehydro-3-deoxyphosphogluconate aldolase/(4S)-4-hydroxy-2-oxoglutarate aldolase
MNEVADPLRSKSDVLEAMHDTGVVAIVRVPDVDGLVDACRALHDGGVRLIEVTMTVPGALQVIETVLRQLGDGIIAGVGTVLDAATVEQAVDAGARFVVSPILDIDVVTACRKRGVVVIPGCLTPTEIIQAHKSGADVVKLFPSRAAGPGYVKDLLGPFPDLKVIPTGGIDEPRAVEFIEAGAFAVGMGRDLLDPESLRVGDLDSITRTARRVVTAVARARAGG